MFLILYFPLWLFVFFYTSIFKNLQSFSSCFFIRILYFFRNTFSKRPPRRRRHEVCSIGCSCFSPPSATVAMVTIIMVKIFTLSQSQSRSPPGDVTKCLASKKHKGSPPKDWRCWFLLCVAVFTRAQSLHFNLNFMLGSTQISPTDWNLMV